MSDSQAKIQGVLDERVEHLNKFRRVMGDRLLDHHLISQDAQVFLFDRSFDIYRDISSVAPPSPILVKKVLLDKAPDMHYVQQLFDNWLVESSENYPYLVQLTLTGLPRPLNLGDRLKMGEGVYEVRLVSPINRLNDSIQKLMVCPVLFSDVKENKTTVDPPFVPKINNNYKKSSMM